MLLYNGIKAIKKSLDKKKVDPAKAGAAKNLVESAIAQNKIVLFSKSFCPYCKRAKELLATDYPNVPVKVFELDNLEDGPAIQEYLAEKTGQRTVPSIFINQKHIGGSDTLVSLQSQGKLAGIIGA